MKSLLRDESGFALTGALALTFVMLALGFAVVAGADTQNDVSSKERIGESSFNLAEAAIQAQAVQLSRSWPGPTDTTAPASCTPTSTDQRCPDPAAIGGGYTAADYAAPCPSSPTTPLWTTAVRDDMGTDQYWTSAINGNAPRDANNNGRIWLRSTGFARCREVSIVALVSRSVIPMEFPKNAMSSNWFGTANQGRKVLLDTIGFYAKPQNIQGQPGAVIVRCTGLTDTQCRGYDATRGQVKPDTVRKDTTSATTALSLAQREALERQAKSANTWYENCPPSGANLSSVGGAPVYVKGASGPCAVSLGGSTVTNSSSTPGALIIENGTLTMSGTATFYGLVYAVNKQGAAGNAQSTSSAVVQLNGNSTIQGIIVVDGLGGIFLGSAKTNLIYDARAASVLRGDTGAVLNKNSFRVLPRGTPQ